MRYSIIIPTHNAENTIENAVNSVLVQDYKDYEIIIVNDASTDNTIEVLKKIKRENTNKLQVITLEQNKKAGGARNKGIESAKGEYIIFLDCDDVLATDALKKIDNTIGNDKPDVVYLGFKMKNDEHEENLLPNKHNSIKEYRLSEWKYENIWDICWNRRFLNENNIRFVENRYFEDFLFYYQGVILSQSYKFLEDITHIYTEERKGSMTTEISLNKLEDLYNNTALLLKFMSTVPDKYVTYMLDGIYRNNNYINTLINKFKEEI